MQPSSSIFNIKVGDFLKPDPAWNASSNKSNHLPNKVEVLAVTETHAAQHGTVVTVRLANGKAIDLSIGWFKSRF